MVGCQNPGLVENALRPETASEMSRTKVTLEAGESDLTITIDSEDVTALRAALNSYIRWLKLAMDTEETIGGI